MSTKCFNVHLAKHLTSTDESELKLFGNVIEYVWIQGIIVEIVLESCQIVVDDGTTSLMVDAQSVLDDLTGLKKGDYVLVQGSVLRGEVEETGQSMTFIDARLISTIQDPNMETLWYLEVVSKFPMDEL